jgi:hypothetical protein
MLPQGIVNPQQLAVLTKVLKDYCVVARIEPGTNAYEDAGRQVMDLYECGVSNANELYRALRANNRIGR